MNSWKYQVKSRIFWLQQEEEKTVTRKTEIKLERLGKLCRKAKPQNIKKKQ